MSKIDVEAVVAAAVEYTKLSKKYDISDTNLTWNDVKEIDAFFKKKAFAECFIELYRYVFIRTCQPGRYGLSFIVPYTSEEIGLK